MIEKSSLDAPIEFDSAEAIAWAQGYNECAEDNKALRQRVAELENSLSHILGYWNGDRNDSAMADALDFITGEVARLLSEE